MLMQKRKSGCFLSGLAMIFLTSISMAYAQPACSELLYGALAGKHDLTACDFYQMRNGKIVGVLINQELFLIRNDGGKVAHVKIGLNNKTVSVVQSTQILPKDRAASRQNFPDAKFFYFPYDRDHKLVQEVSRAGNGFVCFDTNTEITSSEFGIGQNCD